MLKAEDLKIHYGHVEAVKGISFEVEAGEIVTIIGSNGAGKSSTLRGISNIEDKAGGKVIFQGEDITSLPAHEIVDKGICHVPEGRHIFSQLTVEENLYMGSYSKTDQTKAEYQDKLARMYDIFPRLKERRNQDGGNLSGGEQQMLAIARGLMMDPVIMMLDEPSLGLAPLLVEQIIKLIKEINEDLGTTILLVEQNARKALSIAHRGYVMETGNIIMSDRREKLINDPKLAEAYLGVG
ncbi:ABC transporter ATP-binding protein [Halanaerobium kushneri]|uniref:Branched-chain amino acid transport system ATP-binding protein n=1 Tax=Halanaerobium kushneri TaxID=56779 RepID=A0A1N6S0S8_9FIRM|nr:ABC transporter ATP-binding protein [Halanaerobium kushneri]SIQ34657.1 branched-chain amino acid transport system ATP-binding protein [Halanaerobium kushneri]